MTGSLAADSRKIDFVHGAIARAAFLAILFAAATACIAQTAEQAWLRYNSNSPRMIIPMNMRALGTSALEQSAISELKRSEADVAQSGQSARTKDAFAGATVVGTAQEIRKAYPSVPVPADLAPEEYWVYSKEGSKPGDRLLLIAGGDERGVLYGTFALLRYPATTDLAKMQDLSQHPLRSHPAMPIRWIDEWDNVDGSIERGYGGRSIFFDDGHVRDDLAPVSEYARLLASIGINGCNLNNVNNAAVFLTPECSRASRASPTRCAPGASASASASISPARKRSAASTPSIRSIRSEDVVDRQGRRNLRRHSRLRRLHREGRLRRPARSRQLRTHSRRCRQRRWPPPCSRTAASCFYRAFVYNHHLDWNDPKSDRARAAYDIFHPLDGKFDDQRHHPDQRRAPSISRRASRSRRSSAACARPTRPWNCRSRRSTSASSAISSYIAPMWKEVLDFDMRVERRVDAGERDHRRQDHFHRPTGGMVGVVERRPSGLARLAAGARQSLCLRPARVESRSHARTDRRRVDAPDLRQRSARRRHRRRQC